MTDDPDDPGGDKDLPFPDSLCHRCAAPPRYIRTGRSTFVFCPLLSERYPRQPVRQCPLFRPVATAAPH